MKPALQLDKEIDKHQKCIEILECIGHFESMIKLKEESINGYPGTFYELRKKVFT